MISSIQELVYKLSQGDKTLWDIPAKEQERFLNALKEPKDDIARSYNQYKCQSLFVPLWKRILHGITSIIAGIILLPTALVSSLFIINRDKKRIIGQFYEYKELIPEELNEMYLISNGEWGRNFALLPCDLLFIMTKLFNYLYAPYFCFKCVLNLSKYRFFIIKYSPEIIADHAEFSCTSSFLTAFCNKEGIKHYNIMHGEKLFYIRDSFFRYDKCYIWNNYYKDLFVKLRADDSQFVVDCPILKRIQERKKKDNLHVDYRYFLQVPSINEMESILGSMRFVKDAGKVVKYRLHPNHMNLDAYKLIPQDEVENPKEVDIIDALINSDYLVGSYTTSLTHAFSAGFKVILDDVTYLERYDKLAEYQYVLIKQNVLKLSDFQ